MKTYTPRNCVFCSQNGEEVTATHFAPQALIPGRTWEWHPICEMHADGWWDGSDWLDGVGAPLIARINQAADELAAGRPEDPN